MTVLFRFILFVFVLSISSGLTSNAESSADCQLSTEHANKRFVITDLNLRSHPSRSGEILVTLPKGEPVYEYRLYEGWSQVNVASLNITGFVATRYLSEECIPGGGLSRHDLSKSRIKTILIASSVNSYSGSCPCPYNVDRGGRRCGGRSAYSRPGGRSPLCYPTDVSDADIRRFRMARK